MNGRGLHCSPSVGAASDLCGHAAALYLMRRLGPFTMACAQHIMACVGVNADIQCQRNFGPGAFTPVAGALTHSMCCCGTPCRLSLVLFLPMQAVGDDLIDSITGDNIPIFTEQEKYNQSVLSSVERIEAQLSGQPVPGEGSYGMGWDGVWLAAGSHLWRSEAPAIVVAGQFGSTAFSCKGQADQHEGMLVVLAL